MEKTTELSKVPLEGKIIFVIKRNYPGLSKKYVSEAVDSVKEANNNTLEGLKKKKVHTLMKPFLREKVKLERENDKNERMEQRQLDATCPLCFTMFVEKFSRDRHVRKMHSDDESIESSEVNAISVPPCETEKCTECGKHFKHTTSLNRHMKTHQETQESFNCDLCCKNFQRKYTLFKHRERVHNLHNVNLTAVRKSFKDIFVCPMCSSDF